MKKSAMIKIGIQPEVLRRFPRLQVGFLVVEGMDNQTQVEKAQHLLRDMERWIRLSFHQEKRKTHHLLLPWLAARQSFGKEASRYHTSLETTLERVLKRKLALPHDTLTALTIYVALKYLLPYSVDDQAKLKGMLSFALGSESGKKRDGKKGVRPGELFFRDSQQVLSRQLDALHTKKTALTSRSTKAVVHFMALPPLQTKNLQKLLAELQQLINVFCGGKSTIFILGKRYPFFHPKV